ncbi:MAG: hydrogenase nickel incorporation protein HypB [Bacteroidetes bacterium]|nr:hydrogenase nickel incorporation protein HypB [Bacteroidota bacterium]MCK5765800.1 hydrogenase nickel incorporation protein HypB [Bacteroidales bacterium]
MCGTCGCGQEDEIRITKPGDENQHDHVHSHEHEHDDENHSHAHTHTHSHNDGHEHHHHHEDDHGHHHHNHEVGREVVLEQDILHKNNLLAERNRGFFEARNIRAINMVSSPGSGKTTLLEKTITDMKGDIPFFIVEGDQQTMNDAKRIEATGAPVVQVNTGSGCHLDASMVNRAVKELDIAENSILVIENVGNLVCPAMFDLGEAYRVVVISVTEGDDKPIKYPDMFRTSNICIINKTDLLPYVDFDVEKAKDYALRVNHHLKFFELSAKSGEGMDAWYEWLKEC